MRRSGADRRIVLNTTVIKAAAIVAAAMIGTSARAQSAFDGFYLGAFIQNDFQRPAPALDGAVGVWAGYNFPISNGLFIGAEVEGQYDWITSVVTPTGSAVSGFLNARAGQMLASDFLLYAKAGAGFMSTGVGFVYNFGVGGEYALSDKYMIRGEVMRVTGVSMNRSRTDFKLGVGYSF